jgi:hypothetical protein
MKLKLMDWLVNLQHYKSQHYKSQYYKSQHYKSQHYKNVSNLELTLLNDFENLSIFFASFIICFS